MKILMINTIQYNINGIANVILSLSENLVKNHNYQVDITSYGIMDNFYLSRFKLARVNIHYLPSRKKVFLYKKELAKLLKKEKYDIVHIHGNSSLMYLESSLCHKFAITIGHAHNTKCNNMFLHHLLRPLFKRSIDKCFSCSKDAADFIGLNEVYVLRNGINITQFAFSSELRKSGREKYDIGDKKVILHIGHFNEQKNQAFLVRLLSHLNDNFIVMFVGDGEEKKKIEDMVPSNLMNRVIFVGEKTELKMYYSLADVFVLPSLFESFGIVLLEAEINGLPCICSDHVSEAAIVSDNVYKCTLDENEWAKLLSLNINRKFYNEQYPENIQQFDEKVICMELVEQYKKLMEKRYHG